MITIALVFLLIVTIYGFVALERGVRLARPGYEDETGFHFEAVSVQPIVVENQPVQRPRQSRPFLPAGIDEGAVGDHVFTHSGTR